MAKLSIIIKAYNEQDNIVRAVESSLKAAELYDGEVILADSASTDRTVEIARQYPITIVELIDARKRCCGLGAQLGFQHSSGDYVYILDGDMELSAEFIGIALAQMSAFSDVAGLGGAVHEMRANNSEFRGRINRLNRVAFDKPTDVNRLDGGALYRRAALLDVGYMSDQNLHANEEYDLGARLRSKGWRLVRVGARAAAHYAHQLGTFHLLWQRIRRGHFFSTGEVMRAAIEAKYWKKLLREVRMVQLATGVLIYWSLALSLILITGSPIVALSLLLLGPAAVVAVLSYRHRSPAVAALSVLAWHLAAAGLLPGFLMARVPPGQPIASKVSRISKSQREGDLPEQALPAINQ